MLLLEVEAAWKYVNDALFRSSFLSQPTVRRLERFEERVPVDRVISTASTGKGL